AVSQIIIHSETAWVGPPFPMGDYDEQVVPLNGGPYVGPVGCPVPLPLLVAPFGGPGATLWHTEVDCCAAGAGPPPGWGPTFAAYNTGPPPFNYVTGAVENAGAISSYGIAGVSFRPPSPIIGGQQIILSFEFVKQTEALPTTTAFDTCFVEIRPAPCGEPAAVDPPAAPAWGTIAV